MQTRVEQLKKSVEHFCGGMGVVCEVRISDPEMNDPSITVKLQLPSQHPAMDVWGRIQYGDGWKVEASGSSYRYYNSGELAEVAKIFSAAQIIMPLIKNVAKFD